ncbi:leucine-rich repeat-containing protein 31 [Aplochiton taeniatus]
MNQIRRKRSASDRKSSIRFLSRISSDSASDDREAEDKEEKGGVENTGGVDPVVPGEDDSGWGRVCTFVQRLGKKTDSRSLSLAYCDLTATDILELATLLQCLPQLEELDLSWNELIGGSLQGLTSHLQHVGGLRTLRLCGCRLSAEDVSALGEALECVPLLEVLDLSWNVGVGGGALQSLSGKFQPILRELHLLACQLTAADAATLGDIVSGLPKLCGLDVSCNPLLSEGSETEGCRGIWALASSLSQVTSLTTLRLHASGLMPMYLNTLGGSLSSLPALRELDLSCNKGLTGGLALLTPHLAHLTHLETLDLHLCCLTRTDLEALIQVLPSLPELTELNVSSNKEAGSVVHDLVSALPLLQMRRLPLNGCSLNQESYTALALAVPHLLSVDVSWSKVVGGRLALLLDALQPSVTQELRLSSCQLTTEDFHHLAAVCRRGCLSSLRVLDLSYNGEVGGEGLVELFGAGGLGSLEDLDLSLRPLTSRPAAPWLPALLSALPQLLALTHVGMQRWTLVAQEKDQLNYALGKRSVVLECDTTTTTVESSPHQEGPEEAHSEE